VPEKNNSPAARIREAGAFIFDLDGTLYDIGGLARHLVLARPADAFLVLAERKTRKALAGCDYGNAEAWEGEFFSRMSRIAKRPAAMLRAWYFDRYMPRFCDILKRRFRPRPGAAELLRALADAAFPFAVYSDYPLVAERLAALGLDAARVYGPGYFGAQKPAARPFLTIAGELGVPPERVLVIGDRAGTDGAGAAAAGMAYVQTGSCRGPASLDWGPLAALLRARTAADIQAAADAAEA
jgi:FMN phosphatase YigB (HAD superfamily)